MAGMLCKHRGRLRGTFRCCLTVGRLLRTKKVMLAVRALTKQQLLGAISKTATAAVPTALLSRQRFDKNRGLSSVATQLQSLTAENPYTDVVHYTHKNRTWSMQHVDYYSTALAIGLTENGLTVGDKVLSWLPHHFAEQVRLSLHFGYCCCCGCHHEQHDDNNACILTVKWR
jgi:non-ribosomal peptide synthetase component E (peptide arylation enzyme)